MKNEITLAEQRLSDPEWRMRHLYHIVDKNGRKILFEPNWAQAQLGRDLWFCNVILKARQLGVSTYICLLFLDRCLFNSNVAAGILADTRENAENLFKKIQFSYDHLPDALKAARPATIDSARELVFSNGSSLRVATSMRGATLQFLHVSEFGKICARFPQKANEIISGSLNTIAAGQYIFIESTSEGREGHFYDLCKQSEALAQQAKELSKLDFKFHFFPWWKEPGYRLESPVVISPDMAEYFLSLESQGIRLDAEQKWWYTARQVTQGENMKREFPSTPEEAWQSAVDGAYYSRQLVQARVEKRIGHVPYDETVPVCTAWDLGFNDSTAIWFFQVVGNEIHLIDYIEGSGESLAYWLGVVNSTLYNFATNSLTLVDRKIGQ